MSEDRNGAEARRWLRQALHDRDAARLNREHRFSRPHVHVHHADGEAKFWLEPEIELARNHGLSPRRITAALTLVRRHEDEIRRAWQAHFGS